jgi:hypothetical protein
MDLPTSLSCLSSLSRYLELEGYGRENRSWSTVYVAIRYQETTSDIVLV